jgi:hypothetical protein
MRFRQASVDAGVRQGARGHRPGGLVGFNGLVVASLVANQLPFPLFLSIDLLFGGILALLPQRSRRRRLPAATIRPGRSIPGLV